MPAYTQAEINAALVGARRQWSFKFYKVRGDTVSEITDVVSCRVSDAYLATGSNRTGTVEFGPSVVFDQLADFFRPWAYLTMPDGGQQAYSLGTFRLSASTLRVAGAPSDRPQKLEAYDRLVDLQESRLLDRFVVAAGEQYTQGVNLLLAAAGFTSSDVAFSSATLPAPMEWGPGTSRLTAINELLAAINYTSLTMTTAGVPQASAYTSPDEGSPVWSYAVDRNSVIVPGVDTELDLFSVPNVWLGFVSEPDRPTLRSVRRNDDPGSQTSTLSRGREIVQVVDTSTLRLTEQTGPTGTLPAATQADLDALVERARSESSTIYEQVKMTTGIMPFHGTGDVVSVDYGAGVANYRQTGWTMDLKAGGQMTHELRRAVTL